MAGLVSLTLLPLEVTILLMWALAGFLLLLDVRKPAHRAFAAFLFFRALQLLVGVLRSTAADESSLLLWQRLAPYAIIPAVPAILYFPFVYPRRRARLGRFPGAGWILVVLTVVAEGAYAFNHTLMWTFERGGAAGDLVSAARGFHYTGFGPLVLFSVLQQPVSALVGFALLRDAVRERTPSARLSAFLIFAGLELQTLFAGVQSTWSLAHFLIQGAPFPWAPWGWAWALLPASALLVAVVAVLPIVRLASAREDTPLRLEARRLLVAAALAVGSALLLAGNLYNTPSSLVLVGLWRLALPALVTYGLIRYHFFDADLKVKLGIQHGTVVAIIGVVFFTVSEGLEALVSNRYGNWPGFAAAAILLVALKPLEHAGQRVAGRLMPNTHPVESLTMPAKKNLYLEQFALAAQDGQLTAKERRMLLSLQRRLGLPDLGDAQPAAVSTHRRRTSTRA